jgi:hypothetical protein
MTLAQVPAGLRIEAMLDGRIALEGVTTGSSGSGSKQVVTVTPTYLRAGLVTCTAKGNVRVRPLAERDTESDAGISSTPDEVKVDPRGFSEIWLNGRLAYMAP